MIDNREDSTNSLFPPSPPPSSNQSEIAIKLMMIKEEQEQQQHQQQQHHQLHDTLSTNSIMEQEEVNHNEDVLKDFAEFISQSRAVGVNSPRTPPVTPRMMFFLNDEQDHPYQQMQQQQQQPLLDFDLYDLIDVSSSSSPPYSDYQLFPTLPDSSS